jgi:hypothetical protein
MINGELSIGWSRVEITPPGNSLLHGQFHARLSKGTISPLFATALALEVRNEEGVCEQAILVSCDLTVIDFLDDVRQKLEGSCPGFDLRKLSLNATHTHCSPVLERGIYPEPEDEPDFMDPLACRAWVVSHVADAIQAAWTARKPGALSRGFGYAVVGRCRRASYADGSGLMYGATDREDFRGLEACDDHAVNMLFTYDEADKLSGVVVNLASPSQCDESGYTYSSDFWHDVRAAIAARYGDAVHLLTQCAPAGDASPHLLLDQTEECDLRNRMGLDDKGIIARRIMAAVEEGLACASPSCKSLPFEHRVETVLLPQIEVSRQEYELEKRLPEMSQEELERQPFGFNRIWPFGDVCNLVKRYEEQGENPQYEMEGHFIRLGDVALATNPFELFMDYGARIRVRSKALQTFLVQLADGCGFYLPTKRALGGGHYSALTKSNWVGPEGGDQFVEKTVAEIDSLFAEEAYPRTR